MATKYVFRNGMMVPRDSLSDAAPVQQADGGTPRLSRDSPIIAIQNVLPILRSNPGAQPGNIYRRGSDTVGLPMSARAVYSNVGAGTSSDGDAGYSLQNTYSRPVEILAFRFKITPDPAQLTALYGQGVSVALSIGATDITNGFVPVWLLDKRYASDENYCNSASPIPAQFQSALQYTTQYVWKLDYPLILDPGVRIDCSINNNGVISRASATVEVTATGRFVDKATGDRKTWVPYVSSYLSPFLDVLSVQTFESPPEALNNASSSTICVRRLTGRITTVSSVGGLKTTSYRDLGDFGAAVTIGSRFLTLKMSDSLGMQIVDAPALFDLVFPPALRSFEMCDQYEPDSFITVDGSYVGPDDDTYFASDEYNTQFQVGVAVVAYREVAL